MQCSCGSNNVQEIFNGAGKIMALYCLACRSTTYIKDNDLSVINKQEKKDKSVEKEDIFSEKYTIFNRLLALKKEGYTYLTSCDDGYYTGYDQAVADCYEDGDGNEPSYGDWIRERDFVSGKYVTFHGYLLIYGEFTNQSDYDTEKIDLDYDLKEMEKLYRIFFGEPYYEKGRKKEKTLKKDFNACYVDLIAYAIWDLNFENENQSIDSIEKFTELYGKEKKMLYADFSACGWFGATKSAEDDWAVADFITAFVKPELWNNLKFVEGVSLIMKSDCKIIKHFLSESFKIENDIYYIQQFPEDLSIYMLLPKKYPSETKNALEKEGDLFKLLPEELKADKELALYALTGGASLHLFNSEIKSDTEIIKTYISKLNIEWDTDPLEHVSDELKTNKELIKSLVSINGFVLKDLAQELKNDKKVVLTAVKQNGGALKFASDELKADKDIVVAAVSNSNIKDTFGNPGGALQFASDELKGNKEIVLLALANKGHMQGWNRSDDRTLKYVSDELKADKEVVMIAISNDGNALQYASDGLKADEEVVMRAISCEGLNEYSYCIKYALKEFNPSKEMVIAIVSKIGDALEYASDKFKADKEVVVAAISCEELNDYSYCIKYALNEFNPSKELVITIVSKLGDALEYASAKFKADKEVVMAAISNKGSALEYASDELKADKAVVITAVSNRGDALQYASTELQNDLEILALKGELFKKKQ